MIMKKLNNYYFRLIFPVLLFMITGCKQTMNPASYVQWVEDPANGLRIMKDTRDYLFDLQYKPPPLIALKEQANDQINQFAFQKALSELQGLRYFDLRISRKDGLELLEAAKSAEKDIQQISNYLAGDMQYDFVLTAGNDTLPCLLFHTEAGGGVSPVKTFLLAFDTLFAHTNRDLNLVYTDWLLGCGDISFTIKKENLHNIPVFNPKYYATKNQK